MSRSSQLARPVESCQPLCPGVPQAARLHPPTPGKMDACEGRLVHRNAQAGGVGGFAEGILLKLLDLLKNSQKTPQQCSVSGPQWIQVKSTSVRQTAKPLDAPLTPRGMLSSVSPPNDAQRLLHSLAASNDTAFCSVNSTADPATSLQMDS